MTEDSTTPAPAHTASGRSAQAPPSSRVRGWLIALSVILAITFVGSIALAVMAVIDSRDSGDYWATVTGPVGDTFGGILGPILNAAVLATTVYLAVRWQPRQERRQRADRDERELAAKIVAWVAETDDSSYRGVVVSNTSDSVAFDVDLIAVASDAPDTTLRDREATVPPGTWFVPFDLAPERGVGWKLPVSVDTAADMTVTLAVRDANGNSLPTEHSLRPHLPEEENGEPLTHYTLRELRYKLHGKSWQRDAHGSLAPADPLPRDEEEKRQKAERTPRISARPRTLSRRVTADVEELLRSTIAMLCSTVAESGVDVFDAALNARRKVDQTILPGVDSVERNGKGGTITFHLTGGDRLVRMFQNKSAYPSQVEVLDSKQQHVRVGKKLVSADAKKAGARVLGKKNAGDLSQEASEWVRSPGSLTLWLLVLRAIVAEAAKPIDEPPAPASPTAVDASPSAAAAGALAPRT